jgi:hypothetical protein
VVRVVEDEIDKLVIEVADRRRVVRCPACGQMTSKVHDARKVEIRDLPLGRPAPLVWLQWRFDSPTMASTHRGPSRDRGQGHPALDSIAGAGLEYLTIRELPRRHRLSWHLIMRLVRAWAAVVGSRRRARAGVGCC